MGNLVVVETGEVYEVAGDCPSSTGVNKLMGDFVVVETDEVCEVLGD